ncbi:MAG TPA: YceI family protein [Vicinamibacterales bacterium]|nr:YceI family protein [Vicinamibacterales bacterium]
MSTTTTATATSTSAPAQTTWKIDPAHSQAEFAIRHLMISTVKGRFGVVNGTVVTDESDLAKSKIEASIDVSSIHTHEPQRDAHLKSADFFNAEKYPTIDFRGTRITDVASDKSEFKLIGDLSIHGVTREVSLQVTSEGRGKDPWGGERAGFSAHTRIKRSEFGLTWNQALETGGFVVGDEVKITIDVELVKQ